MESEDGTAARTPRSRIRPPAGVRGGHGEAAWRDGVYRFLTGLMVVAAFASILMAVQKIESAFEQNVPPPASPVAALHPLQDSMAAQATDARPGERN